MPYLRPRGNPTAPVWVVAEEPYKTDEQRGFIFSGGLGYVWERMMVDAGIPDYYVIARAPDTDDKFMKIVIENEINHYKPPIIIPLENAAKHFCPELIKNEFTRRKLGEYESEISKYAGSLLHSNLLNYDHFILPTFAPDTVVADWSIRDIVTSLDLGKAAAELTYWRQNAYTLRPLPSRQILYDLKDFGEILAYLERFSRAAIVSDDIETIYPKKNKQRPSAYQYHPGLPVVIGLADSPYFGISFELFRECPKETRILWRALQAVHDGCGAILGQNFFQFDLYRYYMLGFRIDPKKIVDTLIRQHTLFPELPKTLQFMTRQYTREPYYKDEGHGWSFRDMSKLKLYNGKDACVTFEVYLGQEEAFNDRPYLR